MSTQLPKNKIIIIAFALLLMISANVTASGISIKPFVGYQNEEMLLELESIESIQKIEILAAYNQRRIEYCEKISCPEFENNSRQIDNPEKNSYKIFAKNAAPGNYLVKITFNDGKVLFSYFVIKQNYVLLFALLLAILIALLIGVEKNAVKF